MLCKECKECLGAWLAGKHGWIEGERIKDKSSESTADQFLDTVRDVTTDVLVRSNHKLEGVS